MSDSLTLKMGSSLPRGGGMLAWFVCLSAGFFFFYEFFQLTIFDVVNGALRSDFHLSAAQISWMSSTYLWGNILFLLPAGILLDRYSTRLIISMAMALCVLGTIGFALTNSFILACVFHGFSGIGNAFCFLACVVLVSRWFSPHQQALVIGSIVTMAFIGGMMAHTPFAHLNDYYGWRNALLIDGVVGVVLLMWIFLFVDDKPLHLKQVRAKGQGQSVLPGFFQALLNRQTWLGGLYTACLNLPIMVLCALWGASYLQTVHHVSPIMASNIVTLLFIGSIFGCPLAGWISDRQQRRKPLMIWGAIATLLMFFPLLLPISLTVTELCVVFFALGLFTSTQVISYPLIAESNSVRSTGSATGIASVLIMGGAGIGQLLFGVMMQYHAGSSLEHYNLADFQYAMWMFPLTATFALIVALLIQETHCKH